MRDLLVEFLAWLEAGGVARTSPAVVDEFLRERTPDAPPDLEGPELDIRRPGMRITIRGATRASLFGVDTERESGRTRDFVIVKTPGGEPVMLLGPWSDER